MTHQLLRTIYETYHSGAAESVWRRFPSLEAVELELRFLPRLGRRRRQQTTLCVSMQRPRGEG